MLEQIREAIRNARRISFYAYGHQRVVYPYILGTKEGDWNLIAWQINDASRSRFRRGRPRWRCFEVSAIRNLQPAEGEWVRAWFNGPEKDWVDWVDTMVPEPFAAQDPANPSLYLPLISLRIRVPNFLVSAARRLPEIAGKIRLKKPGAMTQSEPSERPRPNELRSEAVADVPEPQRHNAGTRAAMEQAAKKNAEIMAAIRKLADDGVTLASCRSRREFAAKVRHELGQRPSSRG